jgi:hypothetical protein
MYTVHGVAVDVTSDNAADAREKALAAGAKSGLEQLLRNLTSPDDAKSLPAITEKMALPLVQDFEVESERGTGVRYVATLTFRFRAEGVKALLQQSGSKVITSRAPLMLVIPVYRAAGGDLLWDANNPWRSAWKDAPQHAALVPVVIPEGSAEDQQMLSTADIGNADRLQALAQKYKASGAVLAIARAVAPNGDPAQGMTITLTQGGPEDSFHSDGAPAVAQTLSSAVYATLDHLDSLWKKQVLQGPQGVVIFKVNAVAAGSDALPTGDGNAYAVEIGLHNAGDWAAIRAKIAQIPATRTELKSMTRERAVVLLYFSGTEEEFHQALQPVGLTLGPPTAVPTDDADLAGIVPSSGPGAGLIYSLTSGDAP